MPWTRSPTPSPAAREPTGKCTDAHANPNATREVNMLTVIIIILLVLLLTGWFGYGRRRGRRA
jgi:hypothetical protein